ncbi:nucleotidyltransferase domain-containing protein [Streptacidiphilus sp. ASG 303]|uniref:nucleotidyltransferase domain-containing protein n=1 Tax=Streptacidiphilus sp. ASG 303 TaxID=2896847 RepID=UPI001E296131|nr:nucleotidyltransferase domain-containing protein [Streptacidiphilus sp. ASG 303]MCD0481106.1 nucleotidyltransferase domain-containing protein [Streptacidiphilus sp. ASG 303]
MEREAGTAERLAGIAERIARVDGVVGVCLGGSRARGAHGPASDWDLGVYYRPPLDTAALRRLAAEVADGPAEVTEPGGWGPRVDGGGWLTVDGTAVDWIYRDLDRVRRILGECREGRYEVGVQAGHPLGVYSHSYVGELALGRVLADPGGELGAVRDGIDGYPPALRRALVGGARWEVPFTLSVARKGAARGDAAHVAGCLFRAVGMLVQAMHAEAGRWLLNEKGAVREAAALPGAPEDFEGRAQGLFGGLGADPGSLSAAVDRAERLAAEVPGA